MERTLAVLLVAVIYIALPTLVGFAIAGFFLLRQRTVGVTRSIEGLVCSTNIDCPPGYICVNGRCVPNRA